MEGLVVYRVVHEDVLFLIYEEEVTTMAVLYESAIRYLGFLQNDKGIIDYCKYFKAGTKSHCYK